MKKVEGCVLAGVTDCGGALTREHYISASVLRLIFGRRQHAEIIGLAWLKGRAQRLTIKALAARVLCARHNHGLSKLDDNAANVIRKLQRPLKELDEDIYQSSVSYVDGLAFERWLLKTCYGLCAAGALRGDVDGPVHQPPMEWGHILIGRQRFSKSQGLFIDGDLGQTETAPDALAVSVLCHFNEPLSFDIEFLLLPFKLVMGCDPKFTMRRPIRRPSAIIFRSYGHEQHIKFRWPMGTAGEPVVLTLDETLPLKPQNLVKE